MRSKSAITTLRSIIYYRVAKNTSKVSLLGGVLVLVSFVTMTYDVYVADTNNFSRPALRMLARLFSPASLVQKLSYNQFVATFE